jgi:GR25 family glycosyltransferase involved in LPS biosynthesis
MLRGFVITSPREEARAANVNLILRQLPSVKMTSAIYPAFEKVPLAQKILATSRARSGRTFLPGELGILLTNRRIWMEIQHHSNEDEHFLIMESDSQLNNTELLVKEFENVTKRYDLFFWGAWFGHMVLQRSTRQKLSATYEIGTPYMRSVSCAHGYSINKRAAKHLLERTGKFIHPVDEFKRYVEPGFLRVGGVTPELISQNSMESFIDAGNHVGRTNMSWIKLLTVRNKIIAHFS